MRHGVSFRKLGRDRLHRSSLLKNLATALIKHERIVTTLAKGKELRRVGDRMITLGKKGDSNARHKATTWMKEPLLVSKLFGSLKDRYLTRNGGYARLLRIPNRKGDNSPMAVVELVDNDLPHLLKNKK